MNQTASGAPSYDAVRVVSVLHQLTLEGVLSESRKELTFRMLNRTVALCQYDRALLWDVRNKKPVLLGVSGKSDLNKHSEQAGQLQSLVSVLPDREKYSIVSDKSLSRDEHKKAWEAVAEKTSGLSVLWLPLVSRKKTVAGLWLERWGNKAWQQAELKLFQPLMLGYGAAWEKFDHPSAGRRFRQKILNKPVLALCFLAFLLSLFLYRLPLRVVAPCEVVPKDPLVVTAPLNGVIEEITVEPGQSVDVGDVLFVYDKRVAQEELEVARQQLEIIESSLKRSRMQAFKDASARSEIAILEHRLEQEKARVELAEHNVSKLEATALRKGQVVIDDPHEWRGRPVVIGERVLMLVEPGQSKVRAWLPEDDNVLFDQDRPVKVFLNAFPDSSLRSKLAYVAKNVSVSPQGLPSVLAEAEWVDLGRDLKIGLQGTAVLYGDEVPLGYWLLRKPWAYFNRVFGL